MKSEKKLQALYDKAKGDSTYYSFEDFKSEAKAYVKKMKKHNTVCSMHVSQSGMTRRFNFTDENMLFNIVYNEKFSYDSVKVGGCGMDMHWNLKFTVCGELCTDKELDKYNLNYRCSSGKIL